MIVTAWNNGKSFTSGAGYGIKISFQDRDTHFKRDWKNIILVFENSPGSVIINIDKKSFWSKTCRELISKEIGAWLLSSGLAPWQKGHPPKFILEALGENRFFVKQQC